MAERTNAPDGQVEPMEVPSACTADSRDPAEVAGKLGHVSIMSADKAADLEPALQAHARCNTLAAHAVVHGEEAQRRGLLSKTSMIYSSLGRRSKHRHWRRPHSGRVFVPRVSEMCLQPRLGEVPVPRRLRRVALE
eukprot:6209108-Pleurochrysis_carterae.AAC.1